MVPKIFLGIPVYGGMEPLFVQSLLSMLLHLSQRKPQPFEMQIQMNAGDSLVCRSRNKLAEVFLKSDCTHLLFLDSDLIFGLDQIEHLVARDRAIVCGLYPKKQPKLEWVCNMLPDGELADGLHKVKYAGTGCMLIKRCVLTHMIKAFPEIAFGHDEDKNRMGHDLFSVGPRLDPASGYVRYLSEDWFFCQRAIEIGYAIHMDTHVVLKHIGQIQYPLEDPFEKQHEAQAGG